MDYAIIAAAGRTLRRLLRGRPRRDRLHECRRCGTAVDAGTERCPTCETGGIASYRFDTPVR